MALKPPPTAKVVDDEQAGAYLVGASDVYEDEAAKRRGRRLLAIGVGAVILLAIVGAAVGAGVAASKDNGHRSSATPSTARSTTGSTPQMPAAVTVEAGKYYPAPGTPEAQQLQASGTAVQKLTYQLAEDAQTITPQKVVEFIDYFDKVANLKGQGVDVQYFKDQAGSVANWIRTKGYTAAMDLLRNFAQGVKPNALEVIPAIEQVVGVLKAKGDLKEFLKRPPDSDAGAMTPAQVAATQSNERAYAVYAAQQQKSNSVKATAPPTPNSNARVNNRAYSSAKESDPIQQIMNFLDPVGYMNNPAVMGYAWFKPTTIYVVFHVMLFQEQGYYSPYNAYRFGSKPGQHIIDKMNKAYAPARIKFVMAQFRNDATRWKYLNMGTLQKYQQCANQGESCSCGLAAKYNADPSRYANMWIIGSSSYAGLTSPDYGYCSFIPNFLDACSGPLNRKVSASKSRHMWFPFDEVDPEYDNTPNTYDNGAMSVIHEMGHYLGLLHTHQGDCLDQDGMKDTPPNKVTQDQAYFDRLVSWCISNMRSGQEPTNQLKGMNSCTSDNKYVDNLFNFMSYTHAACYKLFTQQQVRRMQVVVSKVYNYFPAPKAPAPKKPAPKKPAPKRG